MAKFKKGTSGNPQGRPKGIQDRRSQMKDLLAADVPTIMQKVVQAAVSGNMTACKLVLDRTVPVLRPVEVPVLLPPMGVDPTSWSAEILAAFAEGRLSARQAGEAMSAVLVHARIVETLDVARRLDELEVRLSGLGVAQ